MGGVRLVTLGGEITEPGGAMVGGSKQKMKTGFGGKSTVPAKSTSWLARLKDCTQSLKQSLQH